MEEFVGHAKNASFFDKDEIPSSWTFANDSTISMVTTSSSSIPYHQTPFGPQRDPLYIVVPITMIYMSILITGVIGNVSTCIVISRNKSMHTATNYYLFSLAVSDLLLLIFGLPVEVYHVWSKYSYVFGEIFCTLRGIAAECSTNASVLTITAFTVERYFAICHPFLSHTMSKLSRAIKLIVAIWIVALIFAVPMALQFGVVKHELNPDISMCTLKNTLYEHSFEIATMLFFVVPMILITVLYAMIGIKLRQSNMMKRDNGGGRSVGLTTTSGNKFGVRKDRNCRHNTGRSSRRVLKMLVAVVVAFFICWAPFHVQRLIYIYGTADDHLSSKNKWMEFLYILATYISGVLYYVSATINPILYNIMSNKFREAFMETLGRTCGRSEFSVRHEQRSYSSLSRSQQRGTGGFFGSRTAGTVGTGMAQESTDCSANSVRDENQYVRSPSLVIQPEITMDSQTKFDNVHRSEENRGDRSSTRKISINDDPRTRGDRDCEIVNTGRLSSIRKHGRGGLSSDQSSGRTTRWLQGNCELSRNNSANSTTINNRSFRNHHHHHHHHHNHRHNRRHNQLFGLGTTSNAQPRKKWWRLFKWLPDGKPFKFNGVTTGQTGNSVANDIESNRDAYAMTSRHSSDSRDPRPV